MAKGRKKSLVGWTSPEEFKDIKYGNNLYWRADSEYPDCTELPDIWKTKQGDKDIKVRITIEQIK